MQICRLIALAILLLIPRMGYGEEYSLDMLGDADPSSEMPGEITDNLRFTVDASTRAKIATVPSRHVYLQAVGVDLYKVFSGPTGDWGTLGLQGFLTRIDTNGGHPPFFDGPQDLKFLSRESNFNFTALTRGWFNLRVGYFEVPYGLEHVINTNGTLRDFFHAQNLGLKLDLGVSVNGAFSFLEYEIALSRGNPKNIYYDDRGDTYGVAGRIGTASDTNLVVGVSGFSGKVLHPASGEVVQRTRAGPDFQWYVGPLGFLGELSVGEDEGEAVVNALAELDVVNPSQSGLLYFQARRSSRFMDGVDTVQSALSVGLRVNPNNHWAFSGQYDRALFTSQSQRTGAVSAQLRYRH